MRKTDLGIFIFFFSTLTFAGAADTAVTGLRINHLEGHPENINAQPVFSWHMASERPGARQTAYHLQVDGVWDSGICESRNSIAVAYTGPKLKPANSYRWTVRVRDERGEWSAPVAGTFSTGTIDENYRRGAQWIRPSAAVMPGLKTAGFRREVVIPKPIKSAWLSSTSAGAAVVRVNGHPVTEALLEPGFTHPHRRRQICTHEITSLLAYGASVTNVISAVVSASWSRDRISDRCRPNRISDPTLPAEFWAVVLIRYEDGSETRVVTDSSWRAAYGVDPVLEAGIYEGERVDARVEPKWMTAASVDWPLVEVGSKFAGVLGDFQGPPVVLRCDLTLAPVSATVVKGATDVSECAFGVATVVRRYSAAEPMVVHPGEQLVIDFGQNASAVPELEFEAPSGTRITLRHAEMLNEGGGRKDRGNDGPEGTPYLANLRTSYAGVNYICRGKGVECYRPQFTFFGYRYLGLVADAPVTIRRLVSVPVSSVASDTGDLSTGVPEVNRLFANCRWGMLSNYLSVPTDCPQRDERVGWAADTQVFAPAATYLSDVTAFLSKWMLDMRDSQRKDGCYSQIAPEDAARGAITGWTDAGIFVPWTLWRKSGDRKVIDENWESMCRYMDHLDARGGHYCHPYGDWLSYESGNVPWLSPEREKWNLPAKAFLTDAYWHADAVKMRDMARATDRDTTRWEKLITTIRRRFAARNLDADGTIKADRFGQCTALMALGWDLLDSDEARTKTRRALLENIHAHGDRLQTGFLGTSVLMDTLSFSVDAHEMAVTLLLQRQNPSWLYSVDQGATTIWERWNSYTKAAGFGPVCMNSFNHYAYGAVAEWMFAALAGIREEEPGYRKILLQPRPDLRLGHLKARYCSPMGAITSEWWREGGVWHWRCTVPPNAEARAVLPDGRILPLESGHHEFSWK